MKPSYDTGRIQLRHTLLLLTILTLLHLIFSASIAGCIGSLLILVMVWGVKRGDYPLIRGLRIFLLLYAALNIMVLAAALISGAETRLTALLWLGLYSAALILIGALLHRKSILDYLKKAPPPEAREKKIHFFHGGWRDL